LPRIHRAMKYREQKEAESGDAANESQPFWPE
jgi:hypothetical protein